MSRRVGRHKLDGVDKGLVSLPARGLEPDGVRAAARRAADWVTRTIPAREQHAALTELLAALGLTNNPKDTR